MSEMDFIAVLDFEATCLPDRVIIPQEIIEFPCVLYKLEPNAITFVSEFHEYVKPTKPVTEFCTTLTGITQQTVDVADLG